ncbi:UDP-N-acetylenolpyruvoylglucosamine reductase [Candidatus Ornithobacterium hominis]|uniref:UDP-N-acetylenolpyruvoylglucosamine reductase n=1 Tax=Candidatus Ornithobacterium hominis TaxID=2497989 RepID=A0A383U026_9FLAO|nr:UDP-N-acetylmuramate dehydrogenase [Candidatus Ornithobacterium hominis]MCT7903972.1 UDP-N-acetylmuramate dehydrogenase [Candidatus Ornithobacterium hominis]SZD72491.1 UDP-N-acetylenolpyruvoylglucosamine reductase [Candidatus Ornithobacterium hominis]SZD72825.1 UDP-N-acetylenolpyruvoylglucosamine reductase [Candidatus Ornithobacterium hominis]
MVELNKNLQAYNTMNVKVVAKQWVEINQETELEELFSKPLEKFYVLGGGSNVLFRSDFDGVILKINNKGIEEIHNDENVEIIAQAGENWHRFVQFTLSKNYGGLENLSLIPGTVGAAPIQNIGAYGVEVKDLITNVYGFDVEEKKMKVFANSECQFGYRDSIFKKELKEKFIITRVGFKLSKKNHQLRLGYGSILETLKQKNIQNPSIQEVSQAVIEIRESKLPNPEKEPNTGSFFKNPVISEENFLSLQKKCTGIPFYEVDGGIKVPAGWLIEHAGWKGRKQNEIGVHPRQALVIVNYGNPSGKAVFDFSEQIIKDVAEKFGITLEREVNLIN